MNLEVLDDLEKYVKVKKRLFYSMIFWNSFNILALRYIMNCFYTHPILKFTVYSVFILPNVWFYIRKFKANRIEIHKILILNYLKKHRINCYQDNKQLEDVEHNYYNITDGNYSNSGFVISDKDKNVLCAKANNDLERQNELEKFLEDYYNNAIYGVFFNLKI